MQELTGKLNAGFLGVLIYREVSDIGNDMARYESESRTETSMPEDGMAGQRKIQVKEIQILCEEGLC